MNFAHVFAQGNPVLIAVFIFLLAMSFVSWYVIVWKGLKLRAEYKFYSQFQQKFANIKDWPSRIDGEKFSGSVGILVEEVENLESVSKHYDAEVKKEILTMHLVQKLDEIRTGLDQGLTVLASVGSSAPFIGLFGTVWGIYNALTDIAAQGNAGLSVVAGPMGEALVATAIGLFAAIPAILSYNTFVRLNRLLVQNLRHVSEQMTVYLSNGKWH
jgi:biopolymer transport protein ExbB